MTDTTQVTVGAMNGGLEGAERRARETARWSPSMASPDQIINGAKPLADARGRDMVTNDGYASGAENIYKDSIVGAQYRLNAKPNLEVLGIKEDGWYEEFQRIVEGRFHVTAESESCWFDASGRNTFTGQVRMAVGSFVVSGESLSTVEWLRDPRRPFSTAIQTVSPDRLSNPYGVTDDQFLRRGIRRDRMGRPLKYCIRDGHPAESYGLSSWQWKEIDAEKPWGRKQVIHIYDQRLPDQSRGIADMVSVLKQMRMTKSFQEITLQNAVVNATYAAAIESELPSADAFATIGANSAEGFVGGMNEYLGFYLGALTNYLDGSKNIAMDGVKIPHLFPGTKLNLKPVGTPGGVGSEFEQSLLRYIAAALGLSYEEFARDYTKTNYSSARASMNNTWKHMQSKKKLVADRYATNVYALFLEEQIARGDVPLPTGKTRDWFYQPMVKDALCTCDWIGASRGQIDETKETQAAILRIESGLSTYEKECARLGDDFRKVFEQRAREKKIMESLDLEFSMNTAKSKPGAKVKKNDSSRQKAGKQTSKDEEL